MKTLKRQDGQDGFTLLELLVVVAILATIGGAVIGTFGNQEENAAQGTATNSLAALENSVRLYAATQGQLPTDLESLACRPYVEATGLAATTYTISTDPQQVSQPENTGTKAYKMGGTSDLNGIGGGLGKKLAEKFTLVNANINGLLESGMNSLRYGATLACDETASNVNMGIAAGHGASNAAVVTGKLSDVTIPNHLFEAAREGLEAKGRNRGRGFSVPLVKDTLHPLLVWNRGSAGYNNVKVGAGPADVLVGLGIGQASSLVGANDEAMLAKAPFYGQIAKDKYAHYTALVKIGTDADGDISAGFSAKRATVVAIVDARGDFLDEEIAEFTDQKK